MLLHHTGVTAKRDQQILDHATFNAILLLNPPSVMEFKAAAEAAKETVKDHAQTIFLPTFGVAERATSRDTRQAP